MGWKKSLISKRGRKNHEKERKRGKIEEKEGNENQASNSVFGVFI